MFDSSMVNDPSWFEPLKFYCSSNTDGSFTMADPNSFLSSDLILPIAKENKYLGNFSYFIINVYVVCTHQNRLIEAILSTLNIP